MTGSVSNKIIITVFQSRFEVVSWWLHLQAIIIWPVRPRSCNPIQNHSKSWLAGLDGLMWAGQEKAVRPYCLHVALLQTLKEKQRWEKKFHFSRNWEFLELTLKKMEKNFLMANFFMYLCVGISLKTFTSHITFINSTYIMHLKLYLNIKQS